MNTLSNVTNELFDVLKLYGQTKNSLDEVTVTSGSGRTYTVANVIEGQDGSWIVTDLVNRGMYMCPHCPHGSQHHNGDAWTQFKHHASVVRIHSSLIHLFQNHPEEIPQTSIDKVAAVFAGN